MSQTTTFVSTPGRASGPYLAGTAGDSSKQAAGDKALVTVVIPTYNRGALLPRAIASVRQQTYRDLEIVVVDDGSAEDIGRIVGAIPDARIRYVRHETNKGLPAARNTGIRAARGAYIAFLDDDDKWREDKLDKQLQAIHGYDAVVCAAVADGFVRRVHKRPRVTPKDLKRGGFAPSGLLVRTEVLRDVMFDESLKQGEDWDAFIRLAQRYALGWVPDPLLLYNEGEHARMTNEARSLSGAAFERRAVVLYKHRQFLGEKWFNFHLAGIYLSYISSRPNKLACVAYAVKRCGLVPVMVLLCAKLHEKIRRSLWMARRALQAPLLGGGGRE